MPQRRTFLAALACVLLLRVLPAQADGVSADDTARFLAGMPPAADSPLAASTRDRAWQEHARIFDAAFERLEQRQLSRIRAWAEHNLTTPRPTVFYMFSGPDFLYADGIFPKAKTYVLSGLEPVGSVPDLAAMRGSLASSLHRLRASLSSILSYSFFITHNMRSDLRVGRLDGTLPVLYVFLARSGKTVREVTPVRLDADGAVQPDAGGPHAATRGVKIVFAGSDGEERTLYYFSTNLANDGVKGSNFLKFCETLAPGDSLVKSASYLLHSGAFSTVRDFLLANSATVIQDDSGIPLAYYDRQNWELQPFGRYLGPIAIFGGKYQSKYAVLFRNSRPIDFGIGYRWRPHESNLLVAVASKPPADPGAVASKPPADPGAQASAASALSTPTHHKDETQPIQQPRRETHHAARHKHAATRHYQESFWQGFRGRFWFWR
jgi:hypothetical protein